MSNYEPGTVAVATVRGVPNVRVMRTDANGTPFAWCAADPCDDAVWATASEVTDVRPLVVLDLDHPEHVATLIRNVATGGTLKDLADEIEAQIRPPKPAEPTGLGAVVEDGDGSLWVHRGSAYLTAWVLCEPGGIGGSKPWSEIDAVRILSAGVDK